MQFFCSHDEFLLLPPFRVNVRLGGRQYVRFAHSCLTRQRFLEPPQRVVASLDFFIAVR